MDVEIDGVAKLALVGKAVRRMGSDRTLIKNMTKRIKVLSAPVKAALKASAVETLPHRGGFGPWVAKAPVTVSVRRGSNTAGVSIREGRNSGTGKRSDLRRIDAGSTRHMLFGNPQHWYPQTIRAGFATRVLEGPVGMAYAEAVNAAVDDTIAEVLHGI